MIMIEGVIDDTGSLFVQHGDKEADEEDGGEEEIVDHPRTYGCGIGRKRCPRPPMGLWSPPMRQK